MPFVRPLYACLLLVLAIGFVGSRANAQTFLSDDVDKAFKAKGQSAKRHVKRPSGDPGEKQLFQNYFEKYYFAAMTQHTPEALEDLGRLRYNLFKQYIYIAKGESQSYLTNQAYAWARNVVIKGRYHPAVTYNALLILGQIDTQYAGPGVETPTPHADANKLLCAVVAKAVQSERVPQFMLTAALVGLERHAAYLDKLPAANQATTTKTLIGVLAVKQLAGNYEPEVRDWIYQQAAQGLANTHSMGDRGRHFLAIGRRVADDSVGMETRVELASRLALLGAKAGNLNAKPVIDAVLAVTKQVGETEGEFAQMFEDLQLGNRGGRNSLPQGRSKVGRRIRKDETGKLVLDRSGLLTLLEQLRSGVGAVTPLAQEADAAVLGKVATALDTAIRETGNKDVIELNVADAIKTLRDTIDEAVVEQGSEEEEELDAVAEG